MIIVSFSNSTILAAIIIQADEINNIICERIESKDFIFWYILVVLE